MILSGMDFVIILPLGAENRRFYVIVTNVNVSPILLVKILDNNIHVNSMTFFMLHVCMLVQLCF